LCIQCLKDELEESKNIERSFPKKDDYRNKLYDCKNCYRVDIRVLNRKEAIERQKQLLCSACFKAISKNKVYKNTDQY